MPYIPICMKYRLNIDLLQSAFKKSGLTQTEAAFAAGVTTGALIRWLNGERVEPRVFGLKRFCDALGLDINDVLIRNEDSRKMAA